jgi:hypothetical protein
MQVRKARDVAAAAAAASVGVMVRAERGARALHASQPAPSVGIAGAVRDFFIFFRSEDMISTHLGDGTDTVTHSQ